MDPTGLDPVELFAERQVLLGQVDGRARLAADDPEPGLNRIAPIE